MSPTSIAKVRLRPGAGSVRVAGIVVETVAGIAAGAAGGLVAAAVVDGGGVAVVVGADGTAVVMADTAADGTKGKPSATDFRGFSRIGI